MTAAVLAGACATANDARDDAEPRQQNEIAVPVQTFEVSSDAANEANLLTNDEVFAWPTVERLGLVRHYRDIGVVDLLKDYLINLPPTAGFLYRYEHARISTANANLYADADARDQLRHEFERKLLVSGASALQSLESDSLTTDLQVLHDAFYATLDQCGRDSAWPDVELFVLYRGVGGELPDVAIEPTFGLTYHEFIELRHQCARHAATYPTLDPTVRDELLAPQREHYAKVILDRLDNELPLVEVPPRYQAEIDELRANGW